MNRRRRQFLLVKHVYTYMNDLLSGYATRGKSILSISDSSESGYNQDLDGNKFTILSYGNGPGSREALKGENITAEEFGE